MRYRTRRKLIIWFLLAFVVAAILGSIIIKSLVRSLDKVLVPTCLAPAKTVVEPLPLEADFYFNDQRQEGIFSERIAGEIKNAKKTLEIAVYSLKSEKIKRAMYEADARGVKIVLIMDYRKKNSHDLFFSDLPRNIERLDLGRETGNKTILMHHKFALIDRGALNQRLIFGSYNWTDLQEKYDPSFIMITGNEILINSFGREFDRLAKMNYGLKKIRNSGYNPWDLSLKSASSTYEVWFGPGVPGCGMGKKIEKMILEAKEEIKIMIWDFTDHQLAVDLVDKAKKGIDIKIIVDSRNIYGPNSVIPYLEKEKEDNKLNNLKLWSDASSLSQEEGGEIDPFLHHHLVIIDNKQALLGTNNWSKAGFYNNDEAAIVTDNQKIIEVFTESFLRNLMAGKER